MKSSLIVYLCLVSSTLFAQDIYYLSGSTEKIEQLVGDYDRQLQQPTNNLTETRYNIWGTDLGVPFKHNDTTFVLFGDIPNDQGFGPDRDPIAYTLDNDPEDGIDLTFLTQSPGQYQPITIPGISQSAFEVPQDGISLNNAMYIYFSTDFMTRSVLAKSTDGGRTFQLIEDTISVTNFVNISAEIVERSKYPYLPGNADQGVLLFGTGEYRKSSVYLAYQPSDSIENKESLYYYSGLNSDVPQWSMNENEAEAIIELTCGGEFSAVFNNHLKKWLLLYGCDIPRGIQFRTADLPWGPYSDAEVVFDPDLDGGYCAFMHTNWNINVCDSVNDPGREYEWGGEYGPYMYNDLSIAMDSLVTIYYSLSTWNPYTVVLMKSILVNPNRDTPTSIKNMDIKSNISVFPNPSNSEIKINGDFTEWKIYSISGNLIQSGYQNIIDISSFRTGIYFIRVDSHSFKIFKD